MASPQARPVAPAAAPAAAYATTRPAPPPPPPAERPSSTLLWGLLALLGGLLVATAQVIQLTEAAEDLEGKDQASFVLVTLGTLVIGLALLLAGCFGPASVGARAAFLIAGGYILIQGSGLAQASGLFSGLFGGFDF